MGGLRARPRPVSPWERRLSHGRSRARAAKTFPRGTGRPSENSGASAFRFCPLRCRFPAGAIRTTRRAKGAGPNTRRQTAMGKSIDERSHEAIRAYLRHRGVEVLEAINFSLGDTVCDATIRQRCSE